MPPFPDVVAEANNAMRVALMMVAAFAFIIFGLAGAHFFRHPFVGQSLWFRLHQAAAIVFAVAHLAALWETSSMTIAGVVCAMVLYAISVMLFLWTQETTKRIPPFLEFSDVDPESLMVWGPYRLVRHPCYVAYVVAWTAGAVATRSPWIAASVVIMTISYAAAARREEAAFLRTRYAAEYRGYCTRTGMFAPKPRQLFDWPLPVSLAVIVSVAAALILTVMILSEVLTSPAAP